MSSNLTDMSLTDPISNESPVDFTAAFIVFLVLFLLCLSVIIYLIYKLRRYKQLYETVSNTSFVRNQPFKQPFDGVSVIPYNITPKYEVNSYAPSVKSLSRANSTSPAPPCDDTPHIAPMDGRVIKKKKNVSNDDLTEIVPYHSQQPQHDWYTEDLFSSLSLKQIRVENWLSENKEMKSGVGEVDLGIPTPCLVKILKGEFVNKAVACDDVAAMSHVLSYQSCDHPNLVKFYGFCLVEGSMYVVSEFVSSTNLRKILISSRALDHSAVISTLSGAQLMNFASGIAEGLTYLHGNDVVHGSLCSQNILVNERLVPKLHECCGENSKRLRLNSSRWSAPEVNITQIYSDKADIWSFGILLWEILSLGGMPFPDLIEIKVTSYIRRQLQTGASLLPIPRNTTKRLWLLMQSCLSNDPSLRPSINEINMKLKRMKENSNAITVARPPGYCFFPIESL